MASLRQPTSAFSCSSVATNIQSVVSNATIADTVTSTDHDDHDGHGGHHGEQEDNKNIPNISPTTTATTTSNTESRKNHKSRSRSRKDMFDSQQENTEESSFPTPTTSSAPSLATDETDTTSSFSETTNSYSLLSSRGRGRHHNDAVPISVVSSSADPRVMDAPSIGIKQDDQENYNNELVQPPHEPQAAVEPDVGTPLGGPEERKIRERLLKAGKISADTPIPVLNQQEHSHENSTTPTTATTVQQGSLQYPCSHLNTMNGNETRSYIYTGRPVPHLQWNQGSIYDPKSFERRKVDNQEEKRQISRPQNSNRLYSNLVADAESQSAPPPSKPTEEENTLKKKKKSRCHSEKLKTVSLPPLNIVTKGLSKRDKGEEMWIIKYNQLKEFRRINGHCEVPARYKPDIQLGNWVMTQRRQYQQFINDKPTRMTVDRILQLQDIDFTWKGRMDSDELWELRIEELKAFRKIHGHCRVPQRYKPNGKLGIWVNTQRTHYKLKKKGSPNCISDERVAQLTALEFSWEVGKIGRKGSIDYSKETRALLNKED